LQRTPLKGTGVRSARLMDGLAPSART
jgi:hypothetical protein